MRAIATLVVVGVGLCVPPAAVAQRFVNAEVSAGATILLPGERTIFGSYVDAMKALTPDIALVGEVGFSLTPEREPFGSERWLTFLGGVRQYVGREPRVARGFVQLLIGAGNYGQKFSFYGGRRTSIPLTVLQPGGGVNIPVNDRWEVRVRADLRLGAADDGVLGGWLFGAGIGRYWGRR